MLRAAPGGVSITCHISVATVIHINAAGGIVLPATAADEGIPDHGTGCIQFDHGTILATCIGAHRAATPGCVAVARYVIAALPIGIDGPGPVRTAAAEEGIPGLINRGGVINHNRMWILWH